MASCSTPQWSGDYAPQAKLTVTQKTSNNHQVLLSWTLQYVTHDGYTADTDGYGRDYTVTIDGTTIKTGTFDINGKTTSTIASGTRIVNKTHDARNVAFSCSFNFGITWAGVYGGVKTASGNISIEAKTSYTVAYNANGGTGAPESQTKWYGEALTLRPTSPTKTGHTFKGWATSKSGSVVYAKGASYTSNADVTLYAVWQAITYPVSFNANYGTGAPSAQTKTYGKTLTLSSVKPTRDGYNFLGWATSSTATTATYTAGGSYTANSAATLYAVWETGYTKPRINNLIVERCDSEGLASDDGTCIHAAFDWETDETVFGINISWKRPDDSEWNETGDLSTIYDGTSGSIDIVLGEESISVDSSYMVRVMVGDIADSTTLLKIVEQSSSTAYKAHPPASADGAGMFETLFPLKMTGGFYCNELLTSDGTGVNIDDIKTPGFYMSVNNSSSTYEGIPTSVGSATFTLEVLSAGAEGQIMQRLITCDKANPSEYVRHFYLETWGEWLEKFPVVLYYSGGSNGTITLSESCSRFTAIEIYYTDNMGKWGSCFRLIQPPGKTLSLSIIEAGSDNKTYIRRTSYTVSEDGTQITPDLTTARYVLINSATVSHPGEGGNYIKITNVLGYHRFNM